MTVALEVENLSTHIELTRSTVQAVGNVGLAIDVGETLVPLHIPRGPWGYLQEPPAEALRVRSLEDVSAVLA